MVTTSLPCSTCAGSTTMPLGVTTPTERLFRSPPAASSCSGVGFISIVSGVAQGERSFRGDVDGQAAAR